MAALSIHAAPPRHAVQPGQLLALKMNRQAFPVKQVVHCDDRCGRSVDPVPSGWPQSVASQQVFA
jgi:hypothetical protein